MTDPKRMLDDDGDANDRERELLRAARTAHNPTSRDRDVVLAAVLAKAAAGGAAAGSASSAGGSMLLKIFGGILVGGAIVWFFVARGTETKPPPSEPVASVVAPVATPSVSIVPSAEPAPPAPEPTPSAKPSVVVSAAPSVSASSSTSLASRLREERALIASARNALQSGNVAQALTVLDTAKTKFPDGILIQERKALEIEALHKAGRTAEAKKLADDFLAAYPNSPHAGRIKELVKP
jgi:hypothetical protein